MRNFVFLFVALFLLSGFVHAEPTDEQVRQAANTLGVPVADLKRFVESYKPRTAASGTIQIDAQKLYEEYKANQLKADGLYKGKTLQVTGKVVKVSQDALTDEYYLQIAGASKSKSVNVFFRASELNKIADFNEGQTVTVVGRCEGYGVLRVEIKDAYLAR
jgi:hypothetical protein